MTVHPGRARRTPRALRCVLTAAAIASAACGGAGPAPSKAPAQETHDRAPDDYALSEPRTIEEAQNQIAQAREMLSAETNATREMEASPRAEPPPPQGAAPSARREREDSCGSPCRALASMKRAVEALCRMTGDADDRCVDAKRTLDESTGRVASCKCEVR